MTKHVIITEIIETLYFKIFKFFSSLRCKFLGYLSCIVDGVYHPGFAVEFIRFGAIHV
jgi:hypothetical protein